jgi:protein pelota
LEINFNPKEHPELLNTIKAVIIGSPGFYKDQLFAYLKEAAEKRKSSTLKELNSKTVLSHCSSGFKHSLNEIMQNTVVQEKIKDLTCFSESKHLDEFFEILRTCDDKVCYGIKSVNFAMQAVAIETLLISDNLFRAKNNATRAEYVKLAERAESNGIKVVIFGSMSPAGEKLKNMTGVAAILRFSLPGLDDVEEDEVDDDSSDDFIDQKNDDSDSDKELETGSQ